MWALRQYTLYIFPFQEGQSAAPCFSMEFMLDKSPERLGSIRRQIGMERYLVIAIWFWQLLSSQKEAESSIFQSLPGAKV